MFTREELDLINSIAGRLTGASSNKNFNQELFAGNIRRRMESLKIPSLESYLLYAEKNEAELARLISSLSIHTTSWFRENPHYVRFQQILLDSLGQKEVFKVWCAATSTGEELYSFALVLEEFRNVHPSFEYKILGTDIDPISLETAQSAVYTEKGLNPLVLRYREHLLFGSGETQGLFTLSKAIRERCHLAQADLRTLKTPPHGPFHLIVCRNVLIYFDEVTTKQVINNIVQNLHPKGSLVVGHSEIFNAEQFGLQREGHSFYKAVNSAVPTVKTALEVKPNPVAVDIPPVKANPIQISLVKPLPDAGTVNTSAQPVAASKNKKALIVDDVGVVRRSIESLLAEVGFESVSVGSTAEATQAIARETFDLITLDLNMPGEGGFEWLERVRLEGLKTPVVLISEAEKRGAEKVFRFLENGAQEYIEKRSLRTDRSWVQSVLLGITESSGSGDQRVIPEKINQSPEARPEVILIGASTGGPKAILGLLQFIDKMNCPPIVIVQHITPSFLQPFAERLASASGFSLGPFEQGTLLYPNHLYLATTQEHIGVEKKGGCLALTRSKSDPVNGHTPSVDHLFMSALDLSVDVMAVLLTGMGADGAKGLLFLQQSGAFTIAQDESDCVVFGMPQRALSFGAAKFSGNIKQIAKVINAALVAPAKFQNYI